MLHGFADLLSAAAACGEAVPAFSCYDLAQAQGVLDAAEEAGRSAVLLVPGELFRTARGEAAIGALTALAAASAASSCVQLDHATDLAMVRAGLEAGAAAVMVDGAGRSAAANAALVAAAVRLARRSGAAIECELAPGGPTDPDLARSLLATSGADCLAVAIGNAHGHYAERPSLDLDLLARIDAAVGGQPLSLHGGSGVPGGQLARAVSGGIAKVNVNTELRERHLAVLADPGLGAVPFPAGALPATIQRLREAARDGAAAVFARLGASPA